VRRLLAFENDVENRVQAALTRQNATEVALRDADRVRRPAVSVQDARDEALAAQTARVGGPAPFALLHLQLDSLAGHIGRQV
jgi:hypothetical protein